MDRVRNRDLWERANQVPMEEEIKRRSWRWIGHILIKSTASISRHSLKWNPQGKRGQKRPQETWRRCVEKEMTKIGNAWGELSKIAQYRRDWKLFVCGLCSDSG